MTQRIYLDCNSSTRIDKRVLQAIVQELEEEEGNPSSLHFQGQQSRRKLEQSRQRIARFLRVQPTDLIFTSGGTEGAYLLLHGILKKASAGHLITSSVEHSCIYQTVREFEKQGYEASFLPTGLWGSVHPEAVKEAIRPDTRLITLMAVNNETGVKTDIEGIAEIASQANIPFVVDGVALLGKESFSIPKGISAMFFSGHKIHAPKGIGVCFCRQFLKLAPLFVGGSQEFNRRAGTENLPGIVGLAEAIAILEGEQEAITKHLRERRDQLEQGLINRLGEIVVNGQGPRIANTANLSFLGVDGEALLINLDMAGISVSHGSACSSGALEPSRILLNMGIPHSQAASAIRFSVGRTTTAQEIDKAIEIIAALVQRMRSLKRNPS